MVSIFLSYSDVWYEHRDGKKVGFYLLITGRKRKRARELSFTIILELIPHFLLCQSTGKTWTRKYLMYVFLPMTDIKETTQFYLFYRRWWFKYLNRKIIIFWSTNNKKDSSSRTANDNLFIFYVSVYTNQLKLIFKYIVHKTEWGLQPIMMYYEFRSC